MLHPAPHPWQTGEQSLAEHLEESGVSRREFVAFCSSFAAILGLGSTGGAKIAAALQVQKRPSVVWIQLKFVRRQAY